MGLLEELTGCSVHWSLGLTVLIGLTASEFSGAVTILALPIAALSISLSALCGPSTPETEPSAASSLYKKRKFCDILDFFRIWIEILEILAASATCARIASATVDYISNGRLREWFLGLESHSLGEPWPDVIGVSVVVVITGLFMLGLEKSQSFSALLLFVIFATFGFFVTTGSCHSIISLSKWSEDFKTTSIHSVLTAATICSFGFVNTFPHFSSALKSLKIFAIITTPLVLYSSTIIVFTLMSHYNELKGTATPLLRVFEIRDVDWARLVMAICIICIVCLALTEILPSLYGLFVTLASKEWQIFLTSLQYRNSLTGAPMLAIFAAGSLAAILAFACPLSYLVKILNTSTLLKCILKALRVLYCRYKPEDFRTANCLISPVVNAQYSKLKQSKQSGSRNSKKLKSRVVGLFSGWKKKKSGGGNCASVSAATGINIQNIKRKRNLLGAEQGCSSTHDDEYLLLNDYCDNSTELVINDDSSEEETEKESVLSSDVEDSYSSTDIDAVVQEYKDKVQVATIDNFNENRYPTFVTSTTVAMLLFVIIAGTVCLSRIIELRLFNLIWICLIVLSSSTILILLMPQNPINEADYKFLPRILVSPCAIFSIELNIVLITTIINDVWPGFIFWFCAGCLLLWRCDCCTCDGLIHNTTSNNNNKNNQKSNKLNITENNISQYSENNAAADNNKYVDTILISR